MNGAQRWQADAVRSARTRDLPSAAALENIWRGVEAQVAAGAPDPLAQDPAAMAVAVAPPTTGRRWQAWALGGLLAAAAAVALTMGLRGTASTRDDITSNDAAAYDAQASDVERTAVRRRIATDRPAQGPTQPQRPDPNAAALPTGPAELPAQPANRPASQAAPKRGKKPSLSREPTPAPVTNVAGEAKALRKAHAAMEAGRLREALAELGKYRKAFPGGVLEPEAAGLRVLIGCKRQLDGASKRARTFLNAHPKSMLRPRLQSACENLGDTETDAGRSRH